MILARAIPNLESFRPRPACDQITVHAEAGPPSTSLAAGRSAHSARRPAWLLNPGHAGQRNRIYRRLDRTSWLVMSVKSRLRRPGLHQVSGGQGQRPQSDDGGDARSTSKVDGGVGPDVSGQLAAGRRQTAFVAGLGRVQGAAPSNPYKAKHISHFEMPQRWRRGEAI